VSVFNHVGLCVTDLARSRRFYEELFGFTFVREMAVPDKFVAPLVQIPLPIGMSVVYLQHDGFVLELLHYDREGNPPPRERAFNEPGLTHMSICVDDLEATCAQAVDLGGSVLPDASIPGRVAMLRDPDGQLIEILPMSYRDSIA
jgi:predicted enzyme related to lactoylglutathione lyase